ncbi:MAG TPA: hypothetical protein V6C57_20165, partial [Coleofasciculaceae cyanobacterium]
MAFWEFLIQKEGDRSWLPLESPKVEILEGRYRIVARSSRINAPVEIRMVQNATHETPPVRRIQKRTSQTNKDGLVVIIPFTRLVPGEWELRCTGDLMAEMLGEGWQHGVQLQVLPLESTSDDWDPDWQEDSTDLTDSAAQAQTSQAQAAQENADQTQPDQTQPDQTQPDQTQPDQTQSDGLPIADAIAVQDATDLPLEAQATAVATAEDSDSPDFGQLAAATLAHSLHLSLERQTYVVLREQPLLLQGQVQPQAEQEPPDRAFAGGHLRLRLFDPQTSQMLVDETQPLAEQA